MRRWLTLNKDFLTLTFTRLQISLVVVTAIQLPVVWTISSFFFPGYNGIAQSLSELAADDSPVRWIIRSSLIVQAILMICLAYFSMRLAPVGKLFLALAGGFLIMTALVPSPSQTIYSPAHRVFSFLAFALSCLWPLFASNKNSEGLISRQNGAKITLFFLLLTIVSWIVWGFASQTYFGLLQRLNILLQSLLLAWVLARSFKTNS